MRKRAAPFFCIALLLLLVACSPQGGGSPSTQATIDTVVDFFKGKPPAPQPPEAPATGLISPRLAAWLDYRSLQSLAHAARVAANAPEKVDISWQGLDGFRGVVRAEGGKYLNDNGQACRQMEQVAVRGLETRRQRVFYCVPVSAPRAQPTPSTPVISRPPTPPVATPLPAPPRALPTPPSAPTATGDDEEWETPPD